MVTRWTKGLLHLLVGGACAALVGWLVFGFSQTVGHTEGPVQVAVAVLVLLTLALVGWLLLAPTVRPAEVALARALLDVNLPDPVDTTSWGARARGLLWAVAVIVLGGISLLALLWCIPQGVVLVILAFGEPPSELVPAALAGLPALVLVLLGVGVTAAGILVQPLLVILLRSLAPRALGPTPRDRLAHAEQQRQSLLRANELARELHDSVGHALTAIGVQAEAGARVAGADPAFAREALERIAGTTRRAVTELDGVLGTLRGHGAPGPGHGSLEPITHLLEDLAPTGPSPVRLDPAGDLDATAARTAYRVVQEGLSNARRHGTGLPSGHIRVRDGWVEVRLENRVAEHAPDSPDAPGSPDSSGTPGSPDSRAVPGSPGGGRGLIGMRERLDLVGGTLEAGPARSGGQAVWRLTARLPAHPQQHQEQQPEQAP